MLNLLRCYCASSNCFFSFFFRLTELLSKMTLSKLLVLAAATKIFEESFYRPNCSFKVSQRWDKMLFWMKSLILMMILSSTKLSFPRTFVNDLSKLNSKTKSYLSFPYTHDTAIVWNNAMNNNPIDNE